MGFFDDLDAEVEPPPEADGVHESAPLAAAIDRVAAGTPFEGWLVPPGPRHADARLEQWARVAFERGRFVVAQGIERPKRDAMREFQQQHAVRLDRAGLVELLRDQPLLARRLVAWAGGNVDPDHPDGSSALE